MFGMSGMIQIASASGTANYYRFVDHKNCALNGSMPYRAVDFDLIDVRSSHLD